MSTGRFSARGSRACCASRSESESRSRWSRRGRSLAARARRYGSSIAVRAPEARYSAGHVQGGHFSYAAHLVEWAAERNFDLAESRVERVLVAGEPGGGEPAFRAKLEEGWGASVTEAMGIGDLGVSLWGECKEQDGMHLGARGFVHAELIDPETGVALEIDDGATGELVLTHLQHRAAPLLRFRTRDHVQVWTSPCKCGRTSPRVRCIGRTDDMLIVRGVNVFPAAVREVVSGFAPVVSGHILVKPEAPGTKQEPPLPVSVELAQGATVDAALAEAIRDRLRNALVVQTNVELVPWGSLRRSEYKSKLVEH